MTTPSKYPITIHICTPTTINRDIFTSQCPDCGRKSRFLCWYYEWYGPSTICLNCGREWEDGEWMPLPFTRGARAKNIANAKARWRKETQ